MSGLKLNNDNSNINRPSTVDTAEFEKAASDKIQRINDRKNRLKQLGSEYSALFENKTLLDNQTVLFKKTQSKIIDDLVGLCVEINNDETEAEGMGSMAIIVLLMKLLLKQRDKINDLSYEVSKLLKK